MPKQLCVLLLLLGTTSFAQQPAAPSGPSGPTGPIIQLRAETRVVEIDVSAVGSKGRPAENLRRADFTVYVDGHAQPFSIFSFNSGTEPVPASPATAPALSNGTYSNRHPTSRIETERSAVILIDEFNGWFENFANARTAVLGALDKLPADERLALYVVDRYHGLQQLANFTTDRARLRDAITHYIPNGTCPAPPGEEGPGDGEKFQDVAAPPVGTKATTGADATPYEQAIMIPPCQDAGPQKMFLRDGAESVQLALAALAASLESVPGRKSVFWISQGFPPYLMQSTFNSVAACACDMEKTWEDTFKKLNDANVAVNTLDSNGLGGPPRLWGPGGVLSMQRVSDTTGGQTYYNDADLAAALTRGIVATRASYTLGFYLQKLDGKYHTVKVAVDQPGVTLGYRAGYYAESDDQRAAANKKLDLLTALANPAGETGIGITAKLTPSDGKLALWLNLDASTLTLLNGNNGVAGQVDELFVERNADGREVSRESDTKHFQVMARSRDEVQRDGLNLNRTLRRMPGAASVEIVLRDHASPHFSPELKRSRSLAWKKAAESGITTLTGRG